MQADVGTVEGVEELVNVMVDKYGCVDVLVPSAGLMPMKTVEGTTEADYDRIIALNVNGPFFLAQVSTFSKSRERGY